MALFEWNHIYYALPIGIGAVAGYMAWQHYSTPRWDPTTDTMLGMMQQCAPSRFRCRDRQVSEATGEERPPGSGQCVERFVGTCADKCVADGASLAGIDGVVAKMQLCDPPESVANLVEDERTNLNLSMSEAGICEADGFAPDEVGIHQCILRSGVDPLAIGAITMTARCRGGVVATIDRLPQLVSRDQAIALWCKRETDAYVPIAPASASASGSARPIASAMPPRQPAVAASSSAVVMPAPSPAPAVMPAASAAPSAMSAASAH